MDELLERAHRQLVVAPQMALALVPDNIYELLSNIFDGINE